jgi:hypothetical protein
MNYKVGDKVEIIGNKWENTNVGSHLLPIGTLGKVIDIDEEDTDELPIKVDSKYDFWWVHPSDIKLAVDPVLETIDDTSDDGSNPITYTREDLEKAYDLGKVEGVETVHFNSVDPIIFKNEVVIINTFNTTFPLPNQNTTSEAQG